MSEHPSNTLNAALRAEQITSWELGNSGHQRENNVGSEQGKFAVVVEIQWIWEGWDFSILQVPQNSDMSIIQVLPSMVYAPFP